MQFQHFYLQNHLISLYLFFAQLHNCISLALSKYFYLKLVHSFLVSFFTGTLCTALGRQSTQSMILKLMIYLNSAQEN